jgi:dipeptidyl aminopeptidase/acylaminoacyl peptidase
MQVWVCNSDGSNPVQLTSLGGSGAGLSRWSPDGQQIAFGAAWKGDSDIYVISAQGGASRQLIGDRSNNFQPAWSRDGRWIYFASNRGGTPQLWRAPAGGGSPVQVTRNGGLRPFTSPDGKFVYFQRSPDDYDVWRVPVDGGDEVPVLRGLEGRFAVVEQGIYFYGLEQSKWFIQFFDFGTGRTTPVAGLEGVPLIGQPPGVSPDRRAFLYARQDLRGSDLMLVENFR